MGHKKVCLECRVTLNRIDDNGAELQSPCPQCSKPMTLLPHRFRPPKKADDNSWEVVLFLIQNGFYFQHIYADGVNEYHKKSSDTYIPYPTNLRDAKEFVERYRGQAIKKK